MRLDLALAFFRTGNDSNAAYHFRQTLGADLPPAVRDKVMNFLDAIRRRKSWSVATSLALAPDDNVNAATSARLVSLFGLPARLSEDARQTSGVGLSIDLSGGYEHKISPDLRFRVAGSLDTTTYRNSQFNDHTLSVRAGPRFLFKEFDLIPEATTRLRRLGGDTYNRAFGLRLSSNWLAAPNWYFSGATSAERVEYESFLGNGGIYGVQAGVAHSLGKATLLRADVALYWERLESDVHSWRESGVGVSVTRELPRGFVVTAGPSFRWRRYDAPATAFGPDARRDRSLSGQVRLSNRYLEFFSFMPTLTLVRERRWSNIVLYDYTRNRGALGIVRAF